MKKVFTLFLIYLFFVINASLSQSVIQTSKSISVDSTMHRYYNPEQGFFQKADFDAENPRFMLENETGSFKFGIGGFVNVLSQYDFGGIESIDFITSQIKIPSKLDPRFLISPYSTRVNLKIVGKDKKNRNIVAFVEAGYNGTSIALRHAYVSYVGFTLGQTWSTFVDLEASPSLIDGEGPNNQIGGRTTMIRYTYLHNKLELSFAAEIGRSLFEFAEKNHELVPQNQIIPNVPLHIKYKDKWGHIQLGTVFKMMNYGDTIRNKTFYVPGYGVSISGNVNVWKGGHLFYQFVGGEGVGNYINDLSAFNYDLIPIPDGDRFIKMTTMKMLGGYLGLQHNWTASLSSNIVYGLTKMYSPEVKPNRLTGISYENFYNYANYFAANILWKFIPYGQLGIEYLFGQKVNLNKEKGFNHRINISIRYNF